MKQNSNNNSNNNRNALSIWDEVQISINAMELVIIRKWLKETVKNPICGSEYDKQKAADILAKIDEAANAYKSHALSIWDEVQININAFELLALRFFVIDAERRAVIWTEYDKEKAAAILAKLAELEKLYKNEEPNNESEQTTNDHTEPEQTADSIRHSWQSFKANAARVALAMAPALATIATLVITGAVFYWAILNVPEWVRALPLLPRAFVGFLFILTPTMAAELLTIEIIKAIDRRRGWFGINPIIS